jgi:hypothetical protein
MEPGTTRTALAYARRHKAYLINELRRGVGCDAEEFSIKGLRCVPNIGQAFEPRREFRRGFCLSQVTMVFDSFS